MVVARESISLSDKFHKRTCIKDGELGELI